MQRLPLLVAGLLFAGTAVASPATAAPPPAPGPGLPPELPAGFTDGEPVGSDGQVTGVDDDAVDLHEAATDALVPAATTPTRYFGRVPYQAVRTAVTATSAPCTMSVDGLTGLVLAPVFKESSAATTPTSAPSPMTLSRFDEWNGVMADTSNQAANHGLYAFRDPYTPYQRAYWHPGIGIWQYDSAGVGAPYTAVESMRVSTVAADVARGMAQRYCAAASLPEAQRRLEAWRPWGYPCELCEGFFQEMVSTSPRFANLGLVDGIGELGGTVARTCSLAGVSGTVPCWYVNPTVGTIQGATGWTFQPDGGSGPTVAPAPLSLPFYVLDRGVTEERHWLRADTGYDVDISASRQIGRNARPRSNQAGSGLTWRSSSGLCDLTTGRGTCDTSFVDGLRSRSFTVTATYRAISLDADGDGQGDLLWYRPGAAADSLWLGEGDGAFSSSPLAVNATHEYVLAGDIDGEHGDDVLWYSSTSGTAYLWRSDGDGTFTTGAFDAGLGKAPLLLDGDGDDAMEVLWYGPGAVADSHWTWNGTWFDTTSYVLTRTYLPFVGDFDANGRDDVFWYGPGAIPDTVWFFARAGGFTSVPQSVDGFYSPLVGRLDGTARSDIVWYSPGPGADAIWFGMPGGTFDRRPMTVTLPYTPVAADLDGDGKDGLIWDAPDGGADHYWTFSATGTPTSLRIKVPGTTLPIVGAFSDGGADGVLWYRPGPAADVLWYRSTP